MFYPGGHEQTWGQCNGLHRDANVKGCELAVRPGQRWALTSRLEAISWSSGHCGSPGFPTSSQCRVSPGRQWALFSGRRTIHPGGRVLRRSSQSLRLQRKGRRGGSLGLWGEGGGLWAGPQKALSFSTSRHWACTLVLCVPISGLLSASPQCQDLGQLHLETLSGEGRPPWDPSPPEMEQLQKLVPLFRKFPSFARMPLGRGCLQGPDPGVPTDEGPWDEELLPNS